MDEQQYVLDPVAFRAWLAEQQEDAVVGTAMCMGSCPLANFLQAVYGGAWNVVIPFYWLVTEDRRVFDMPEWARFFATRVDRMVSFREVPVSAADALWALDFSLDLAGLARDLGVSHE